MGVKIMPAKNPRVSVVLDKPLYQRIEYLAKREGISISLKMRDLVKEAVDLEEDIALSTFAEQREQTFKEAEALTHEQIW
jgi:predicted DNA-binding protein